MYKLKEGFILRNIGGENIIIPSGNDLKLDIMITVNDTGAFIWNLLDKGISKEDLIIRLVQAYDISYERALNSVNNFLTKLNEYEFLA